MQVLYDLVCSFVIGGILLMMVLGFNGNIVQQGIAQTVNVIAQSNMTTLTEILEYEFRKMGYGLTPGADSAIILGDTSRIVFKADIDNNGTIDTVRYSLMPRSAGNENKNTKILLRQLNSAPVQPLNVGVTSFRIWYFDAMGNVLGGYPIVRTSPVKSIKLALALESTASFKRDTESYRKGNLGVYWEQTFKPKNLR